MLHTMLLAQPSLNKDIVQGKHTVVEVVVVVFSVTKLGKIKKKPLLQPPLLIKEVLVELLTDVSYN